MADKSKEEFYTRPPKVGGWTSFKTFLWNSETNQLMGRTFLSWAKIFFFYACFYTGLISFFFGLMALFYQTLDMNTPKWQMSSSLIGNNPGLGFRPMPPESHVESTLIWYKSQEDNFAPWTVKLDDFLKPYREQDPHESNVQVCDFSTTDFNDKVCRIDIADWVPCTKDSNYNYHTRAPCIFLKLNKIFGWMPEFYNDTENLPDNMPQDLKNHIIDEKKQNPKGLNTVWVSCEGENPADVENIGSIQYIPRRGFPGYFFPYKNQKGYLSPIIAVWFETPNPGVLINIECKAWAHNIHHDRAERRGSVHFELMID
ncbi:sodium/potassium-transporting ATPase subunit beta-2-like [Cimex lectularius]|uniref:Sodium/potassium-transporting ATPase subunit beta n=1 Tax=Cimex lectularius TaxID=79782 RepID=A0A8I6RQJ9_CIMLE|nr:sodium/potassium-transporting ATPase subunit beta-2-like [Cimex lectularius]